MSASPIATKTSSESFVNHWGHSPRPFVARRIPSEVRRLLDVGCNTGAFGEGLKASRPIEVWGVEPGVVAAEHAAKRLDRVVCAPFDAASSIPDRYFDVVTFNDVLEHLVDPWAALRLARAKLTTEGCVVASIPNFLHQENLLHVLKERDFRYEETGIRDRTHLRFFTRKSAVRLFEECGYEVCSTEGANAQWWSPSLKIRLAYRLLGHRLEETKYIQYILVAKPLP